MDKQHEHWGNTPKWHTRKLNKSVKEPNKFIGWVKAELYKLIHLGGDL